MMKIEELVAQVKQSTYPDLNVDIDRYLLEFATRFLAAYTEQQEPVAIVVGDPKGSFGALLIGLPAGTDLYAAPVVPADRSADLERQVAALTKERDLAVKQVGDVARELGLCQIQRDELAEQVATLKYDLMVQTESCKQLGHIVAEKDSERIQFREQVTALKVELNHRSAELTGAFHQLAASQLREKELRRLLAEISTLGAATYYDAKDIADEALALPTDDSALQARLAEEREKCAKVCDEFQITSYLSVGTTLARMIRELS